MYSLRNSAHVIVRWLYVHWATVLTQILFRVNSWAFSASGVMIVFALYLHSYRRPLRIVGFVTNPSCCSPVCLYSVCVCVHILEWCQVCSLYLRLVQTEISHISAAWLIAAHVVHPKFLPAWHHRKTTNRNLETLCCVVCCIPMCLLA